MAIQRPKGTLDILPGTIEKWQYLEAIIREICEQYGFEEIRTPIFESTELFQRGVGETTDIVNKEMYTFLDKGKRSITLRPEGTASVCRAYTENKLYGQPQPIKLFYIGPMFRYENTQAGRFRQFHQFGVEVLGAEDPMVDAEVINLVWDLYKRIGLKDLEVHINSVGCPKCRKKHRDKLEEFMKPYKNELCKDCQTRFETNPLRIMDCKNNKCQELTKDVPTTLEMLCDDCLVHFEELKKYLDSTGMDYKIDPKMVRGLDYYRKTAFEVLVKEIGAQSAICGGGRYDGLVEEIGGPPTPGIGFAMGIERVLTALEKNGVVTQQEQEQGVMVIALGDSARKEGFLLTSRLREQGIPTKIDLLGKNLKNQLKAANRANIKYVLIIGDEELQKNTVILKDMNLGEQMEIANSDILTEMKKRYSEYLAELN